MGQCPEMSDGSQGRLAGGSFVSALHSFEQESQLIRCKDPLSWDLVCGSWGKVVPKLGRLETRP